MALTKRQTRLMSFLLGLRHYNTDQLLGVARELRYPCLLREAALRWLVHLAPLSITKGAPFASSRREVRRHYHV